jgi:hypothetical protein
VFFHVGFFVVLFFKVLAAREGFFHHSGVVGQEFDSLAMAWYRASR